MKSGTCSLGYLRMMRNLPTTSPSTLKCFISKSITRRSKRSSLRSRWQSMQVTPSSSKSFYHVNPCACSFSLRTDLTNANLEFGLEIRRKAQSILRQNQGNQVKKVSPLQYACSLGLYNIVEMLLQAGAKPDGLNLNERQSNVDYYINPLVICMNEKHHNKDLEIEMLGYKRRYSPQDVDHIRCLKLLLSYKANANAELIGKKRKPRPIFHAALKSFEILKLILDKVANQAHVVNQVNAY